MPERGFSFHMILRPRQTELVNACVSALATNKNTLAVAPTGAGKTVMLSAIAGRYDDVCVLQHREELVRQNRDTYRAVNGRCKTDLYTANRKRWARGGATFAMVQTLSRPQNLETIPPLDLLVIDETHHVGAASYIQVIEAAKRQNPGIHVLGVTATPERADGRSLMHVFDNVADVITLHELINAGHLVKPRTFVIDTDIREELDNIKIVGDDFDMGAAEAIMDRQPVNERVLAEWHRLAGNRQTVVFTSTVKHAEDVCELFRSAGKTAEVIHGKLGKGERKRILEQFDARRFQVLVNCAVLTEGWDSQPVSCVVLLRPCSAKGTVLQMVGRGLRKVNPEKFPGVIKDDCIILDFGYSLLTHGNMFGEHQGSQSAHIHCPDCRTKLPAKIDACPLCGYEFPKQEKPDSEENESKGRSIEQEKEKLDEFGMTEVRLLELSPFKWEPLFGGAAMVANGISAEAFCLSRNGKWFAIGKAENRAHVLYVSHQKAQALAAADDFLRAHGDTSTARKSKRWLELSPSEKQLEMLGFSASPFGHSLDDEGLPLTRYRACCRISWRFNENLLRMMTEN